MTILPVHPDVTIYLTRRNLLKKFSKQIHFLETNPKHPSLNIELLEPKSKGIYSFRIDRKYCALFIFRGDKNAIEILSATDHYQ